MPNTSRLKVLEDPGMFLTHFVVCAALVQLPPPAQVPRAPDFGRAPQNGARAASASTEPAASAGQPSDLTGTEPRAARDHPDAKTQAGEVGKKNALDVPRD